MIAHPKGDLPAATLAVRLAARFATTAVAATGAPPRDAPLWVATASHRWHRDAAVPVVVVPDAARDRESLSGDAVLCGARDERDAPAVTLADVLAQAIELPLVLARVVPEDFFVLGADGVPVVFRPGERDPVADRFRLRAIVAEAGIDFTGDQMITVLKGEVSSALASAVVAGDAPLLVVGPSRSGRLKRALFGSNVEALLQRCTCPLVICPDDPAAGMGLRELWAQRAQGLAGP